MTLDQIEFSTWQVHLYFVPPTSYYQQALDLKNQSINQKTRRFTRQNSYHLRCFIIAGFGLYVAGRFSSRCVAVKTNVMTYQGSFFVSLENV